MKTTSYIGIKRAVYLLLSLLLYSTPSIAQRNVMDIFDAVLADSLPAVQRYIERGRLVDKRSDENATPLMYAADMGSLNITRYLLEAGADVNATPDNGKTALISAVINGHLECSELLLDNAAKPNLKDYYQQTALHYAVENGDSVMVEMLLDYGATFVVNAKGDSELMIAATNNDISLVELLIEYQAEINYKNKKGQTALCIAAENNNLNIMKALVQAGADIHIKDKKHFNAICYAVKNNHLEIVKYLVDEGADVTEGMTDNLSLLTLAKTNPDKKMSTYLKNAGAKESFRPYLYKTTIATPFMASKKDFMMGFEVGMHDVKRKASINFGVLRRPGRSKVLVKDKENYYSQYRERRTSIYFSLEKEFSIIWRNNYRFGVYAGCKAQCSTANYRGIKQKAPLQLPISPLAGLFAEGELAGFKLGYEYTDWGYENMWPHKIMMSFYVNLKR